jgi:putative membrane protein
MMRYYGFGFDHLGLAGWVWIILVVVFWVLVVTLLVLGIRWLLRADRGSPPPTGGTGPGWGAPGPRPDDPLEILRQRYARGEIDDEEFERRRRTLTGG